MTIQYVCLNVSMYVCLCVKIGRNIFPLKLRFSDPETVTFFKKYTFHIEFVDSKHSKQTDVNVEPTHGALT